MQSRVNQLDQVLLKLRTSNRTSINANCRVHWKGHLRASAACQVWGTAPRPQLQLEVLFPDEQYLQVHVQDLPARASHTAAHVQSKEAARQVPVSLSSFRKTMIKFLVGYVKSMLFASMYLSIVRRSICGVTQLHRYAGSKHIIEFRLRNAHRVSRRYRTGLWIPVETVLDRTLLHEQDSGDELDVAEKA